MIHRWRHLCVPGRTMRVAEHQRPCGSTRCPSMIVKIRPGLRNPRGMSFEHFVAGRGQAPSDSSDWSQIDGKGGRKMNSLEFWYYEWLQGRRFVVA
jgi:hypothetical protein